MQRAYSTKMHIEYAVRAKKLWDNRPNRPFKNAHPPLLLGKVVEEKVVSSKKLEGFEVIESNINLYYLENDIEGMKNVTAKNLMTLKNNHNFISSNTPRGSKFMGHYNHYNVMRMSSSDDEDNETAPQDSLFDETKSGWLIKRF